MDRVVLRLMCDDGDEISFLFGPWGAVDRTEAIRQIETGERTYTLQQHDGSRTTLTAVGKGDSKRLCISRDGTEISDLGDAPRIGPSGGSAKERSTGNQSAAPRTGAPRNGAAAHR